MPFAPLRIRIRPLLPPAVGVDESAVYQFLRLKPRPDRIFILIIDPQVVPFSLEADHRPVFLILSLKYAPESARIVPTVLPVLEEFDAGPVDPGQLVRQFPAQFFPQAPAALIASVHQAGFTHIQFISAVAPAVPVDGTPVIPPVCRILRQKTAEPTPGQVFCSRHN